MINRALRKPPDAGTHWSTRTLARAEGVGKSTVQRWFALFGVKPHLAKTFKLSTDPLFIEKVRDSRRAVPQPAGVRGGPLRG